MTKRKSPAAIEARKSRRGKQERGKGRAGHPSSEPKTKTAALLTLLARPQGASLAEMQTLTRWQPHSVRGFLAGTVKKVAGVTLTSEKPAEGPRRYRVQRA